MTRVITISSGKGGVGKTFIGVNLAVEAARRGLRVCLFDADLGLANVDILLKLQPRHTLVDVIEGRCRLGDIVLHTDYGLDVIPGSSGVDVMANLPPQRLQVLKEQFAALEQYDLVLFDTSSGIGRGVMSIIMASPEVYLVVTPEPTSLTDAYGMIKLLYRDGFIGQLNVIVNNARTRALAEHTFERFREVARVYLHRSLPLQGVIPFDSRVGEAVREQRPFILNYPDAPAARRLADLADKMLEAQPQRGEGIGGFWRAYRDQLPDEARPGGDWQAPAPSDQPRVCSHADSIQRLSTELETLSAQVRSLGERLGSASPAEMPGSAPAQPRNQERRGDAGHEVVSLDRAPRHGRNLRHGHRATPIDGLQLRRIMGRLLLKAQEHRVTPIAIDSGSRVLAADNPLHLTPGRYSLITLELEAVSQGHQFVHDVLESCDIDGCDVRELGSRQHLWLTSDRDGCIKLEEPEEGRSRLEIYLMAGQSLSESATARPDAAADAPAAARVIRQVRRKRSVWQRLAAGYRDQLVLEPELSSEDMSVYRLKRFGKPPLFCGIVPDDAAEESEEAGARLPSRT